MLINFAFDVRINNEFEIMRKLQVALYCRMACSRLTMDSYNSGCISLNDVGPPECDWLLTIF